MTPVNPMNLHAFVIMVLSFVYWLLCVYEFHKDVGRVTNVEHTISPIIAALFHLIPIWNCYWVFKWTKEAAHTQNRTYSLKLSKWLYGTFLLLSMILWTIITFGLLIAVASSSTNGFQLLQEIGSYLAFSSIILAIFSIVSIAFSVKVKFRYMMTHQSNTNIVGVPTEQKQFCVLTSNSS